MYDEQEHNSNDAEQAGDMLSNFNEGEYAIVDRGRLSETKVYIHQVTQNGIWVRDINGNEFSVNVLRLSKY